MASGREERNYSSPPKRLKLDESAILCTSSIEIDKVTVSASFKTTETSSADNLGLNSGTLNICEVENNLIFDPVLDHHNSDDIGLVDDDDDDDDNDDDDDDDDVSSTVSNLSDLSGLSDMSGQDWKPIAGPMSWVQKQMLNGVNPRTLLSHLMGDTSHVPTQVDDLTLWKIIVNMLSEPPRRTRLRHINSLKDVVSLLKTCSRIIVLTGAGVSVSCGIPDFRSRDGIYSRLAVDFPHLPDPQAMFDINYFRQDPRPFFKFAKEIYPGQFKPSPCHRFIKMLEKQKKLLRNYTQNIDTLEKAAGIENVVECHGSFATASCTVCGHKMTSDGIRADVFEQKIPLCPVCPPGSEASRGVMKPDIVFFGEGLPESFHTAMAKDKDTCDLLIVIGTSLKVRPVALIPSSIPNSVPQILINRERLPHLNFDVELLGDSDVIIDQLCRMLGDEWSEVCWRDTPMTETDFLLAPQCRSGYGTECSEGEGEMSVDSTRDSGLGRINSVDDLALHITTADSRMEEVMDDNSQCAVSACTSSAVHSNNDCASCKGSSAAIVKCRKIQRNHVIVENKDIIAEACSLEDCVTNGELELASGEIDARMSIEQEEVELESGRGGCCLVTRRHLSLDSTRDSGIGDGSNSSHSAAERHMSVDSQAEIPSSLATRLPENTYFFLRPNRYVFPGAEVTYETDEDEDNRSISDCSDLGSETQQNSWFCQNQLPLS